MQGPDETRLLGHETRRCTQLAGMDAATADFATALRPQSPALKLTLSVSQEELAQAGPELGQWSQHDRLDAVVEHVEEAKSIASLQVPAALPDRTGDCLAMSPDSGVASPVMTSASTERAADVAASRHGGVEGSASREAVDEEGFEQDDGGQRIPIEVYDGLMSNMGVVIDSHNENLHLKPMLRGASTVSVVWSPAPKPDLVPWLRHPSAEMTKLRAHARPSTSCSVAVSQYRNTSAAGKVSGCAKNPLVQSKQPLKTPERPFSHIGTRRENGKTRHLNQHEYAGRRRISSAVPKGSDTLTNPSESLRNGITGRRAPTASGLPQQQRGATKHDSVDVEREWSFEADDLLRSYAGKLYFSPFVASSRFFVLLALYLICRFAYTQIRAARAPARGRSGVRHFPSRWLSPRRGGRIHHDSWRARMSAARRPPVL